MTLLAGTGSITVDGQTYMVEGSVKYKVSSVKRETLSGYDGVHGFKETKVPGRISATFRDYGGLTVADFNKMTGAVVVLNLANGKTIIGRSMWTTDEQEVDTADAKFDVIFEGPTVTEQATS